MPRKFYVEVALNQQERLIRTDLLTVQREVGEGQFATYPSLIFEGANYEEVPNTIVYLPNEFGYPPPGAVKVTAVVTESVFDVIDKYQSGTDAEGKLAFMAIYEGSAFWEDTGEPVMTMEFFMAQKAAEEEAAASEGEGTG